MLVQRQQVAGDAFPLAAAERADRDDPYRAEEGLLFEHCLNLRVFPEATKPALATEGRNR
jgi:hypothetical protein